MKTLKQYNAATQSWDVVGPAGSTGVVDLTSASSDYALAVGETAVITYTSATSVPLRVATGGGNYIVNINPDGSILTTATGGMELRPNNTTYTNTFRTQGMRAVNSTAPASDSILGNSFNLGYGSCVTADISICTNLYSKTLKYLGFNSWSGAYTWYSNINKWTDDVPWVSLGTITLPVTQSGKIIIRRII